MDKKNLPKVIETSAAMAIPSNWNPNLTPDQQSFFKKHLDSQKAAPLASLPMVCKWESCVAKHACPLFQTKVSPTPEGKACPYEIEMINNYLSDYCRELEVSPNDITDMALIKEMVTWHIYEWRAQAEMAAEPNIIREAVIGYDTENDEPVTKEVMNPIIIMLEKASKTRAKIRDALIATREAKAKEKGRKQVGLSELAANIQQKIEEKKKQMEIEAKALKPKD